MPRRGTTWIADEKVLHEALDDHLRRIGTERSDGMEGYFLIKIIDEGPQALAGSDSRLAKTPDCRLPEFVSIESWIGSNMVEILAGEWTIAEFRQDEPRPHTQLRSVVVVPDETTDTALTEFRTKRSGGARRFESDTFFGFSADERFKRRDDCWE